MTAIGYLRWFFNYQREEIQLLLGARGIQISTGEISKLSEEFFLRFYTVHKNHSYQMKELFETNKGFILHLDGSAEAGDEITFTAKEGMTEITIDSWIIPSESRQYIKPFLQHIKTTCGSPFVVVRDMSIRDRLRYTIDNFITGYYDFSTCGGDTAWQKGYNNQKDQI